ncbi:MAG TPA: type II secretion system protein [Fimbriimonadaceae bacterium]|nr:type II secretion system protein [Fimbriimonadaceae bacterium]
MITSKHHVKRSRKKLAFTLTELLVVIAIIAILASLIFPVTQSAKARAKETACMSNLHQIYVAMQMYREDFNEYPPSPGNPFILDTPYLGGTRLHCQAKDNKWVLGDYTLYGPPTSKVIPQEERTAAIDEYENCREKRGDAFPIADDPNHRKPLYEYNYGLAVVLLVRENGSVQRIPERKRLDLLSLAPNIPCTLNHLIWNL